MGSGGAAPHSPFSALPRTLAGGHRDPVPGVDREDEGDELGQLPLLEVPGGPLVDLVRDAARQQRDRLGERQGGLLLLGVEPALTGLLLDPHQGDALIALARLMGVGGVHMEAVGAVVELGGADLHQLHQGRVQALAGGRVQADQRLERLGAAFAKSTRPVCRVAVAAVVVVWTVVAVAVVVVMGMKLGR
ncbi:hypothetical protein SANT12839_048410 [Streptomyces antimycoticus]|uniref:Uncharacterized protein n=1 Tax=Streptomyces antimycoticus TaxID=68175 RepID=A0A4D4KCQ8_9ACTN|nr:hypothetical protein SANT12839_048410 [Streptomyces antimycoticus]